MMVRGVRGATTVNSNTPEEIIDASAELLNEMIRRNEINPDDLAAAYFTTTSDLNAEFPSVAAREKLGWTEVPLLNGNDMNKTNSLIRCIRVLLLWNTDKPQHEIKPVYIKDAKRLRPDIVSKQS